MSKLSQAVLTLTADMSELFLLNVRGDDLVYPVCLAPPLHHRWEAPLAVSGKSTFYVN